MASHKYRCYSDLCTNAKKKKKETDRRTERVQEQTEDRGGVGGNGNDQSPFL